MKLTTTNPEVTDFLKDFPVGVWPIKRDGKSRVILIVKGSRRIAQIATLRLKFHFYWVPINIDGSATYGLITTFFDDEDEPLVIRTPLFDDETTRSFLSLLSSDCIYVYFFDEQNRELLGFRAESSAAHRFRAHPKLMNFLPESLNRASQIVDELLIWFGNRTQIDDAKSFPIDLHERMFPDDLDEDPDNPGDLDERDIASALSGPFGSKHVFQNPIRADSDREFVDVLVETTKSVLLIQAKDSPTTDVAITRHMKRKRANTIKRVKKAVRQLKGAISVLNSAEYIDIISQGCNSRLGISNREVFGLVIIDELFDPDRSVYSSLIRELSNEKGIPSVLLDHSEFQQLTFFRDTEDSFMSALRDIFAALQRHDTLPRSTFGLRTGESVVRELRDSRKSEHSTSVKSDGQVESESDLIITPFSDKASTEEFASIEYSQDTDRDWLHVVVDRVDVEKNDISRAARMLSQVLVDKHAVVRYRGRIELSFFGYSHDPRELYEIQKVRDFCSILDYAFPYWFYFLSTESVSFILIAACMCPVETLEPGIISFGEELLAYITSHYHALNWLFNNYSLDEQENMKISREVANFFSASSLSVDEQPIPINPVRRIGT